MKQLGKYELFELIGTGAHAEVYHAKDLVLGHEVALKILSPAIIPDTNAFNNFLKVIQAYTVFSHPHLVNILDAGESNGQFYIATRFINGPSLDKILEQGNLTPKEVRKIARQVGSALYAIHQKNLSHGDITPANIVRSAEGDYFLTDPGLTCGLAANNPNTQAANIIQTTAAYIPPEMWMDKSASPATDQYSLACILYEALTGKVLFTGQSLPAIMTAHVLRGSGDLLDVPLGFRNVLGKALNQHPVDRYPDIKAFVAALFEDLTPKPIDNSATQSSHSHQVSPPPQAAPIKSETKTPVAQIRFTEPSRRRKPIWPLILTGTVVLIVVSLALLWKNDWFETSLAQNTRTPIPNTITLPPHTSTPTRTPTTQTQTININAINGEGEANWSPDNQTWQSINQTGIMDAASYLQVEENSGLELLVERANLTPVRLYLLPTSNLFIGSDIETSVRLLSGTVYVATGSIFSLNLPQHDNVRAILSNGQMLVQIEGLKVWVWCLAGDCRIEYNQGNDAFSIPINQKRAYIAQERTKGDAEDISMVDLSEVNETCYGCLRVSIPTNTPVPPTQLPVYTTQKPSNTPTEKPEQRATSVIISATPTKISTATKSPVVPSPTITPRVPSNTPQDPTDIPDPTNTPVPTSPPEPTNTPVPTSPPTTPTKTPIPTSTPTSTPVTPSKN